MLGTVRQMRRRGGIEQDGAGRLVSKPRPPSRVSSMPGGRSRDASADGQVADEPGKKNFLRGASRPLATTARGGRHRSASQAVDGSKRGAEDMAKGAESISRAKRRLGPRRAD